ncbi:hypothetical protein L3X38_011624 [Prunus dulcis]|uniref:Uncharacterized protein n=1 Tax=Prunus dulcis TaxID=3755 RepID=A0AAD4ZFV9_PRUDU|nr:hypothetical protein L3X38_011624 [Prunus dulcis]
MGLKREAQQRLKEMEGKGKQGGTEQVELPQNKKSEAANTNGTNERPASIRRNPVKATGSHHVGVFNCNNRAQGTGCNIEDNEIDSKDSQFVGVYDCGNESKKPWYKFW